MSNKIRLCDAGIREQEWAQKLIEEKKLPADITFKDLLDHAMYDTSRDEITLTIKAAHRSFRVLKFPVKRA